MDPSGVSWFYTHPKEYHVQKMAAWRFVTNRVGPEFKPCLWFPSNAVAIWSHYWVRAKRENGKPPGIRGRVVWKTL